MRYLLIPLALLAAACTPDAYATDRNPAVRAAFMRQHPCPATGKRIGACPGYVVDHVIPLCIGGADSVRNMQWQTDADGLAKDKIEWKQCRAKRAQEQRQ